jgi:DNA mismatch repair protein MutS2
VAINIYQGESRLSEVITEREIKVLQFDQIRLHLAMLTVSSMGEKMAENLNPSADCDLVKKWQKETTESRLLNLKNKFNPGAVDDIRPLLERAYKGAMLAGSDLATIMAFIKEARRWPRFFKDQDQVSTYPLLSSYALTIQELPSLSAVLERSLDQEGHILDSASPEISSLRRKKQSLQGRIREKLDQYIRNPNYQRYLQDFLVTIRGGRYVLPVKQEYRQSIEGVVHDQSSSGATLFIEPLPVVQMQNELNRLEREEEKEIEKILYHLSQEVSLSGDVLLQNRKAYAELDFINARGRLSLDMAAEEPFLVDEIRPLYILHDAVHPLLPGEKVPLSINLGDQVNTLVITGPNTGGKTVALKTIGLLAIMAQSGLHLPAKKGTKVSVFGKIRSDIGDEQSIAQSLSTFSGHMRNIIEIIAEADQSTLVLFDELGAGTDPSEGSALAMAILEDLTNKGALTVATTHINELKLFAQVQSQMQNGAMEFDPDTLTPTYTLLQGVPGQSNAFYIAGQLGLPLKILQKAKSFIHRAHEQVESIIASLVEDQQRFHRDSRQAAMDRSRAEMLAEQLEKEHQLLKARREDILLQARDEARQLIKETKSTLDRLIKEMRTVKTESGENALAGAEKIRLDLNRLRSDIEPDEQLVFEEERPADADLFPGQKVYISSLKQKGEVVSFTAEEALVQVGSIRVHLPLHELRLDRSDKQESKELLKKNDAAGYSVEKNMSISNTIDLRGLNIDEAEPLVEKLLDNALWAGLHSVDIIHGKGSGKLKNGLRVYLKNHGLVKNIRSGYPAEGGEGVTVVEIKQ